MKLTLDLGGTKIRIIEYTDTYDVLSCHDIPTSSVSPGDFFHFLYQTIKKYHENKQYDSIGISCKGIVKNGVLQYGSLFGGIVEYNINNERSKEFGIPVLIKNDVTCMGVAENIFGYGKQYNNFVLLNIGTGVKLSLILDRKVQTGVGDTLGEIHDYFFVPELGLYCEPNDLVCGKGIAMIYHHLTKDKKTAKELYQIYEGMSNELVTQTFSIFATYLGRLLLRISYMYNPEVIIIDGGLKELLTNQKITTIIENIRDKECIIEMFRPKYYLSSVEYSANLGSTITL